MRVDALGLFWQDMPKIKKAKADEKYLAPPKTWLKPTYLPYLRYAREFNVPLMSDEDLITAHKEKHEFLFDIECYINYFLIAFKDKVTKKIIYFERIGFPEGDSDWNDDPRKLCWIMQNITTKGFNSNGYDIPIAVMAMAGKAVAQMKAATNMIIGEGYKPWQVLKKMKLVVPPMDTIDIMEVTPLQGSLKIYGGRCHTKRMQDLPFHPETTLTPDQIAVTRYYCINDLDTTDDLDDRLQTEQALRRSMSKEYGVDLRSKSDAQIAEAVISHELEKLTGVKPRKPNIEPGTAYRYQPPAWLGFQTPLMQRTLEIVKETLFVVGMDGSIDLPKSLSGLQLHLGSSVYTMGIGGLHSTEKRIARITDALHQLEDIDVTSYYPFIILLNKLFPKHLGAKFLQVLESIVMRRLKAKADAAKYEALAEEETDPAKKAHYETLAHDNKVISDSLKIVINGTFGKLGSKYSLFYSPDLLIQVTLTGQLALLMLIEALELNGIPVVSGNTDGIVVRWPREKEQLKNDIVKWWEQRTGFNMEGTLYRGLYSWGVNDYIAVKQSGGFKAKGKLGKPGLKKNPTSAVCMDAVEAYLEKGVPLLDTIKGCTDIRKFVSVRNVGGGGVAVTYRDPGEPGRVNMDVMKEQLHLTGWEEYRGGTWVQTAWRENGDPLDKVKLNLRAAYMQARFMPIDHKFLGKAIRWYYAVAPEGCFTRVVYAANGKKVPKSDGAKELMELPTDFPTDVDYGWYENECKRILKFVGLEIN